MLTQLILGVLIGVAVTWVVAHIYYRMANADQNSLYGKLSKDIRDAIIGDSREKLTICELNELIEQKTIDPESPAPFPYTACPKCGSEDLKGGEFTHYEHDKSYWTIACKKCGWNDWTQ